MELLFGVLAILTTHIWILKELKNWNPYEYDTLFCRDVRANAGMFVYSSDLEEKRKYVNSKKSKF